MFGTAWVHLIPLLAGNVLFGAGLFAHQFLYNFYLQGLGLAEGVMGVATAALTVGTLVGLAPAGLLVDRIGFRPVLLLGTAVAFVGLVLGALVTTPWTVYAAAAVAGLGTGAWQVAVPPAIMQVTPESLRSRIFSLNVGLIVGSGALWTAGAGVLAESLGPGGLPSHRLTLLVGAGVTAGAFLLFAAVRPGEVEPGSDEPNGASDAPDEAGLAGLAIPPRLALLVVLVTLWMLGNAAVLPFFNIYFQRVHEMSIAGIGGVFAGSQAVTALVVVASGEVAARAGPGRVLGGWVAVFGAALGLLATAPALGLAVGLYVAQGFVGPSTNPLIDQILQERAPPGRRGVVSTWRYLAAGLSGLVGASVGGWVLEAGTFGLLFGGAAAVGLASGAGLVIGAGRLDRAES